MVPLERGLIHGVYWWWRVVVAVAVAVVATVHIRREPPPPRPPYTRMASVPSAVPTVLFALVHVHRPSHTVTVEGTAAFRTRLRRRVVVDDVRFFSPPTALRATQHRLHGCLRARNGTVHFPVYRFLGECAAAGYALVAHATAEHRDTYVFRRTTAEPVDEGEGV